MQTLDHILAEIPLFRGMKAEHLELIAGCASNSVFQPGEYAGRQGEPAENFWILRAGRMALEIHVPGRGAITVQTIGENEVVGWSWLVPPHQWHFDVRALTQTRALQMNARCIREKCDRDRELGNDLMSRFSQLIVQRLEATQLQLLDVYGDHL